MGEGGYGESNNMKLECRRPNGVRYMYIDSSERRADKLFIRSKLPVSFENDLSRDGCGYIVVICTVAASRESDFLECMADLERTLILEGHADYRTACDEVMGMVR